MYETDYTGLFIIAAILLGLPLLVIIGLALERRTRPGGRFWRNLLAGLLAATAIVGAEIGWGTLWVGNVSLYHFLGDKAFHSNLPYRTSRHSDHGRRTRCVDTPAH